MNWTWVIVLSPAWLAVATLLWTGLVLAVCAAIAAAAGKFRAWRRRA